MIDVKRLLAKICDAFVSERITVNGNYNCTVTLTKRCGIVTLVCNYGTATAITKGSWNTICNIPEGFHPYYPITMTFAGIDNNTNSAAKMVTEFRIQNNQLLVYGNTDAPTNNQPCGAVSYVGGVLLSSIFNVSSHRKVVEA